MIDAAAVRTYREQGYLVVRDAVPRADIDQLLSGFLSVVERVGGKRFSDAHAPELAAFLKADKPIQAAVYDEMRKPPWLTELSLGGRIVEPVRALLGPQIALLRKIPFRIDVPLDTTEYAVWHQDHFYVRGNPDIVSVWIPMQDTSYRNGCLKVMPGSHTLGPLAHDNTVLRKRHYPSNIFQRPAVYVEMNQGDVLLFHSYLLHSSSLNISDAIRFSINARFTEASAPTDAGMGGIIPVPA